MDKNDDILIERIETFLRGEMSAEEDAAFKQEIKSNPELRNRAMVMTSLIKGLEAKNSAKEKNIFNGITSRSKVRPILWWATSIAAVFAIFFGIYKDHRYRILDATVSPYYTEYDMSDISRGNVDSASVAHLYTLFTQIQQNRNLSGIVKELEPIYHFLENDFTYNAYANDISWNLALAYIKDDQIDKAIPILKRLEAENPDTPISLKAKELLKRIREL